jgi:hypothetical protein
MEGFVVAAVFTYPHEFAVLKLILEQRNISFFFENETMISVLPFHSNAIGGIRLKVHYNDLDEVQDIIKQLKDKNDHLKIV